VLVTGAERNISDLRTAGLISGGSPLGWGLGFGRPPSPAAWPPPPLALGPLLEVRRCTPRGTSVGWFLHGTSIINYLLQGR